MNDLIERVCRALKGAWHDGFMGSNTSDEKVRTGAESLIAMIREGWVEALPLDQSVIEQAREVVAKATPYIRNWATFVRIYPATSKTLGSAIDALAAAGLLHKRREPKILTDEEIVQHWSLCRNRLYPDVTEVIAFARNVVAQSYPDFAAMEKRIEELDEIEKRLQDSDMAMVSQLHAHQEANAAHETEIEELKETLRINTQKPIHQRLGLPKEKRMCELLGQTGDDVAITLCKDGSWDITDASGTTLAESEIDYDGDRGLSNAIVAIEKLVSKKQPPKPPEPTDAEVIAAANDQASAIAVSHDHINMSSILDALAIAERQAKELTIFRSKLSDFSQEQFERAKEKEERK